MNTLIALAGLAVLILVLEIINLRKTIVPLTILGLLAALGFTFCDTQILSENYNNMIVETNFSRMFSSLFIVITIFIVAMGQDFYKETYDKISDYTSLKLFLLIGAISMVSFGNLTMFFIGLEILSITLYILAGSNPTKIKSNEAGMKYFLLGSFASGFILFGIALIYGATASFDLNTISNALLNPETPNFLSLGVVLVCIGMLFKIAAFPFHFWAPDVYQGSPTLTTATMSTLAKVAAMATLFKIHSVFASYMSDSFTVLLICLAIATMFVGNIMALKQDNIKRMLAYSGISHAGFMMIALFNTTNATAELFYYAAAYFFASIAAFAIIIAVCKNYKDEKIKHFKGLGKQNPLMAAIFTMALLSMAGIPIFAGFFGKFFLFGSALESGHLELVIFGVINSIISVYYYFKVINAMYTQEAISELPETNHSWIYKTVAVVAILLNIAMGLCPSSILNLF